MPSGFDYQQHPATFRCFYLYPYKHRQSPIDQHARMALQQYLRGFVEPLASEHPGPLLRLLGLHNSTARSLAVSVGPISVSPSAYLTSCRDLMSLKNRIARSMDVSASSGTADWQDSTLAYPPPSQLQSPWNQIALRHCACAHAMNTNNWQEA